MKIIILALAAILFAQSGNVDVVGSDGKYLGKANTNKYDPNSISNPYGQYGSKYSPNSVNNEYGSYGSKYSTESAKNPYATEPPKLFEDNTYKGNLSTNKYDPNSVSNPYSTYHSDTYKSLLEEKKPANDINKPIKSKKYFIE